MASSTPVYNQNSASVRRLMQECKEMASDPSTLYTAAPLDVRLFKQHGAHAPKPLECIFVEINMGSYVLELAIGAFLCSLSQPDPFFFCFASGQLV